MFRMGDVGDRVIAQSARQRAPVGCWRQHRGATRRAIGRRSTLRDNHRGLLDDSKKKHRRTGRMSRGCGVVCGVVVVEERDARGSSLGRSRRTGTLVHATPRGTGGGGGGGSVAVDLVGDAGIETYMFQRGRCKLFRSFVHHGKLTVCTAGMRHQIMLSEADPVLLGELCDILVGENSSSHTSNTTNSSRRSPGSATASTTAARARAQPQPQSHRASGATSGCTRRRPPAAEVSGRGGTPAGPLAPRSVNAIVRSPTGQERGGDNVHQRGNKKGRRMGVPADGLPEAAEDGGVGRKSTRKVSPKKSAGGRGPPREVALSEDQQRAVDLVVGGRSVFFTGCAGTGKSLVLNRILAKLAEAGVPGGAVYPTATTGLAACHVKGTTLQQFSGIGKAAACGGSPKEVLKAVRRRPEAVRRWKAVQVLIMDEISMLDGDTFDALEFVARSIRGVDAPFGGVRLVLSGDFFQLPPVSRKGEPEKKLCFEARSWKACVQETVELKLVFRQQDNNFVKLLSEIRWGQCTPEVLAKLRSCAENSTTNAMGGGEGSSPQVVDNGIEKTQLLTHKADVLKVNEERLGRLDGAEVVSKAENRGNRPEFLRQLDDSCSAPATLRLKVGAQVMLVKNLATGRGLANGSRGVVVRFAKSMSSGARLPVVRFASGLEEVIRPEEFHLYVGGQAVASRRQLPLALAWALSVHKSQGMSLDRASVCLSRAFEYGQAYVALSRVRSLEGLSVVGTVDPSKIRAHPRVVSFYRALSRERKEALRKRGGG